MENLNNEFERLKEAINIQKIKALTDRAATLYNGNTIDYYGEYISVTSPAQEDAANKIIATLYNEIEPYLQQIETYKHFFDRTEWDALDYVINVYKQTVQYVIEYNTQQASNKAQEEHHKAKPSKRGRQTKLFDSYLFKVDLDSLHKAMEGKAGKEAALIIRTALREGLINKPTFAAVEKEFGDIGNRSGYNKYMSDQYNFTEDEVAGARKQLGLE